MHTVYKTVFVNMSEDFDREDDLQFFAQSYLIELEYTDDELREMDVLWQGADSCVSNSSEHTCIVVLSCAEDWQEKEEIV